MNRFSKSTISKAMQYTLPKPLFARKHCNPVWAMVIIYWLVPDTKLELTASNYWPNPETLSGNETDRPWHLPFALISDGCTIAGLMPRALMPSRSGGLTRNGDWDSHCAVLRDECCGAFCVSAV